MTLGEAQPPPLLLHNAGTHVTLSTEIHFFARLVRAIAADAQR